MGAQPLYRTNIDSGHPNWKVCWFFFTAPAAPCCAVTRATPPRLAPTRCRLRSAAGRAGHLTPMSRPPSQVCGQAGRGYPPRSAVISFGARKCVVAARCGTHPFALASFAGLADRERLFSCRGQVLRSSTETLPKCHCCVVFFLLEPPVPSSRWRRVFLMLFMFLSHHVSLPSLSFGRRFSSCFVVVVFRSPVCDVWFGFFQVSGD